MDQDLLLKKLIGIFLEEFEEHRSKLEQGVLALERAEQPAASEQVLQELFRAAHSLKGAAQSVSADEVAKICHELEQWFSDLRAGQATLNQGLINRLLSLVDELEPAVVLVRARHGAGRAAERTEAATPNDAEPAPPLPAPIARAQEPEPHKVTVTDVAVRVDRSKLDVLLTDNDTLTMACSRLTHGLSALSALQERLAGLTSTLRREQASASLRDPQTRSSVDRASHLETELLRITEALHRDFYAMTQAVRRVDVDVRRMRMVPFHDVCEGLDRAVRDLSLNLDKGLRLHIESEDVEVDRAVAQRLRDPLLHLVRNAATHGIEPKQERAARGKPSVGSITLKAQVKSGELELSVADDGCGLDLAALRARAESLGLPIPEDDAGVQRLAFAPGLSTSSTLTSIAGRGVGLDAVRRAIEAMHGSVKVQSEPERGARFVLRIPLKVSTLRCLSVAISGQTLAIPCAQVKRIVSLDAGSLLFLDGSYAARVDDQAVPVVSLARVLGVKERPLSSAVAAVVIESEVRTVAFVVDEIVSEGECVLRNLPSRLSRAANVSGVASLPSGHFALVLSPNELCRGAARLLMSGPQALNVSAPRPACRLLVVDDSLTTRTLLKSILEDAGYHVTTAHNGVEARRLLELEPFSLVVSDVQMPEMDGLALTQYIRGSDQLTRLPVVLVTALGSDRERQLGMEAGANAYLVKTAFDQESLLQTIASHV